MIDISEFRSAGHQIIDRLADYLEVVHDETLFPSTSPAELEKLFQTTLPGDPTSLNKIIDELEEKLFPNCCHVNHPGYFGFITPTPNPAGILGDLICSALNQNIGVYTLGPGAVAMERQVIRWLCDLLGFDENSDGHLTSGGMMANYEGLKFARDYVSGNVAQYKGIQQRYAVYASDERHISVDKAVDMIGIGRDSLRIIPTQEDFSMSLKDLKVALKQDKMDGIIPMCLVGIAGSTNTGAVDNLKALRQIANDEGMWLHVDAAYGGGVLLSDNWSDLIIGAELADSVTIDPHKWFFAPVDAGAILVKDKKQLLHSYGMKPPYLKDEKDTKDERYDYYAYSFEQSRRFRGLKVWMSFKRYGKKQLGKWVDQNIEQAKYLYKLCQQNPEFVPANYPKMSAICIRFDPGNLKEDDLRELHIDVARKIEENGNFWITTTQLKEKSWFRINPVNFRTRLEHMEGLMGELKRECTKYMNSFI